MARRTLMRWYRLVNLRSIVASLFFPYMRIPIFLVKALVHVSSARVKILVSTHDWLSLDTDVIKYRPTVWKFLDFSITQILREINFEDSWSAKCTILPNLHSEFWFLWFFSLFEGWNFPNEQNSQPLKWQNRQFLHFKNPQNWFYVKSAFFLHFLVFQPQCSISYACVLWCKNQRCC